MAHPVDLTYCYLIEPFGTTAGRTIPHTGDDWARRRVDGKVIAEAPDVYAAHAGTVVYAAWHGVAGNRVIIRYWFGLFGDYGHLRSVGVRVGQEVGERERIGQLGGTGKVTGPHLHYTESTDLARLLKGVYPYWKNPKTGHILWKSVDAWAASAGLVRPDYRLDSKASAPLTDRGFLMALNDDEQAEILRRSRENSDAIAALQTWIEAARNDQLYDGGTKSRAQRIHAIVEGMSAKVDTTADKVGALDAAILGLGNGSYSWLDRIRSVMNALEARKQ